MTAARASAVVVTAEARRAIPLLDALRAQTVATQLEVVIAAPADEHQELARLAHGPFVAVHLLDADPIADLADARAACVRAATAPVILMTETHSLPDPGWARTLIDRHAQGAVAVGARVRNANPTSAFSAAMFAAHFGAFCSGRAPAGALPRHNTSYLRAVLASPDADLHALLADEGLLHAHAAACGTCAVATDAQVRHLNISRPASALRHAWLGGRSYGAVRTAGWSAARRLAYALAWPLIALRRLRRELPRARWDGRARTPAAVGALLLTLAVHSLGEAAGALAGRGPVGDVEAYNTIELRRDLDLSGRDPAERRLLEAIAP
ncbi:unannotated protein [freshwater metagenome]|uniref:Unannotated protein n=1 Tax=freshwater metagenome TaxID=449393 RepID=A0A6J7H289_9ZZZZ|nr:hypothetical protein [Actinomycetota bacterium]